MIQIKYLLFLTGFLTTSSIVQLVKNFQARAKNDKMSHIHSLIRRASLRYFQHQTFACSVASVVAFGLCKLLFDKLPTLVLWGSGLCLVNMLFGLISSTAFNVKTAIQAERKNSLEAFAFAFKSGILTTIFGVSNIITSLIAIKYFKFMDDLIYFTAGYALASFVIRVMGGVFTKAADIGTDLAGKLEAHIKEDSPQNPGVIADNVGDNVGDGGMATTVLAVYLAAMNAFSFLNIPFISFMSVISISAIGLSVTYLTSALFMKSKVDLSLSLIPILSVNILYCQNYVRILPMAAAIVGTYFTINKIKSVENKFVKFVPLNVIFFILQTFVITRSLGTFENISTFIYIVLGIFLVLTKIVELFTSASYSPVQSAIKSANFGAGMTIITGLKISYINVAIIIAIGSLILSCTGILSSSGLLILKSPVISGGLEEFTIVNGHRLSLLSPGIALSAITFVLPSIMAQDLFGAVADNAGGLVEMSECDEEARKITDELDVLGNMVKATTKVVVFICGTGIVTILMNKVINRPSVMEFSQKITTNSMGLGGIVLVGLLSSIAPYALSALLTNGVQNGAMAVASDIRYQFTTNKRILTGEDEPNYNKTIDITSSVSRKTVFVPFLMLFSCLFLLKFLLQERYINSTAVVIGEAIGILTSLFVSLEHSLAGAIYDNMKKGRELVGITKKSASYDALVNADLVGDLFKDSTGPSQFSFALIKFVLVFILTMTYGKI